MRELKFRAWSKNLGRYIGGIAINQAGLLYGMDLGFEWTEENAEDYVIEQYTGLKDKNDRGICEGDIIEQFVCGVHQFKGKKCGRSTIWQVRWNEKECCFELHYLRGSLFGDSMMSDGDEYEVIGNIHENPELLKGDK